MKKTVCSRFKMLRTVALLLRVLAWVSLLGGIVISIIFAVSPSSLAQFGLVGQYNYIWLSILTILIGAVLCAILFFALAEHIYVCLSIEENTRKLRELLDKK